MKDNIVSVCLWNHEICKLRWVGGYKQGFGKVGALVSFNPDYASLNWNLDPLGFYTTDLYLVKKGLSDICRAKDYEGLPRFLSGSLPDDWGNAVFSAWVSNHHLKHSDITAVDKLSFIGNRGMGALEFTPSLYNSEAPEKVALEDLYDLAIAIQKTREGFSINLNDNPSINDLMAVGMSAGGMHPKAIIAIDWASGEVRSGQTIQPGRFNQCILKFNDFPLWPSGELEYVYYQMARAAGIDIEDSWLLPLKGENHFITSRFDRKEGGKLHTATLQALAGPTESYESIFQICRQLMLPYREIEQLFRRAVFEYVCGVCDNHDKNFSFIMDKRGRWSLAPAYDLTFSVNLRNLFIGDRHYMTVAGKTRGVEREDLLQLAEDNDIRGAAGIISEVLEAASSFEELAKTVGIESTYIKLVSDYIDKHIWD